MKTKLLAFLMLSIMIVSCNETLDVEPNGVIENQAGMIGATTNPPTTTPFNVPTNFVLVNGSSKEALLNFGVSPNMSQEVRIKPKFSAKASGQSNFTPLPPIYGDLVIPPNTQLSNVITVRVQDFGICADNFTMRMEVDEVRIGGHLIPVSQYTVLSFGQNGVTDLAMTGISCPTGGSGQPGIVKGDKFLAPKP